MDIKELKEENAELRKICDRKDEVLEAIWNVLDRNDYEPFFDYEYKALNALVVEINKIEARRRSR